MMHLLSPLSLIALCWGLTGMVAAAALMLPDRFDLIALFMWRESLDRTAFGPLGAAWLGLAAMSIVVGDLSARRAMPPGTRPCGDMDPGRAADLVFRVNAGLVLITIGWVALTAMQAGGPMRLVMLALTDNPGARDLLLENKLFTGMRLAYAALPATGCLAAMLLATGRLARRGRWMCLSVLAVNAVALTILPVVMSQRLLLLQLLLSSYIASCLVRGRLVALPWLGVAAALFLAVWVARESLTNPLVNRGWLDLGVQKLAFYFVNDLWNSFAPIGRETAPTLGGQSLRGVMTLTMTDETFDRILAERLAALDAVRGGGEFSLLTAPYVDFGPWGAVAFLAAMGFALRVMFQLGMRRRAWTAIYAQAGAALLFSTHGFYLVHQNFLFSLMVIAGIVWAARRAPVAESRGLGSNVPV